MKFVLSLQVIEGNMQPKQIAVSADPQLIKAFVSNQKAMLSRRDNNQLPPELQGKEARINEIRMAMLEVVIEHV